MGDYTGLKAKITLKESTPQYILDTLDRMTLKVDDSDGWQYPDHPLFNCGRRYLLRGSSSYLKDFPPTSERNDLVLNVSFNVKNYDSDIDKFLDWIFPYTMKIEHGWCRYEYNDDPSLVCMAKDGFKMIYPDEMETVDVSVLGSQKLLEEG